MQNRRESFAPSEIHDTVRFVGPTKNRKPRPTAQFNPNVFPTGTTAIFSKLKFDRLVSKERSKKCQRLFY